ncbi:hypothetical protein TNCV_617881 [Trichonephila clavipes]|nr:hypothetical protein TNCV_617881 [Trichonephila clavipes]
MRQWMKHGSITTRLNQKCRQLSGQQPVKPVQSDQKTQTSTGKVAASVFWDAHGILFTDYFEEGKTVNSEYYMALLDQMNEKIKKKRHQM